MRKTVKGKKTSTKSQPDLTQSTRAAEIMVVSGGTKINLQGSDNTVLSFTVVCDRYNSRLCYPLRLLRNYPWNGADRRTEMADTL